MNLTVLSVAFPFAPVCRDAVGGAEQVLFQLDRALVEAGHTSIVVAQQGSEIKGTLVPVEAETGILDDARERGWARHRGAIERVLKRWPVDLIHLHGIDFYHYLPPPPVPVLATLHLPIDWYPVEALNPDRSNVWFNCVSRSQHRSCPQTRHFLEPIENGVPTRELTARHAKRRFALYLGRICPEKGVHLAIEAAKRAGIPLMIAGAVYPYAAHQRYFEEKIAPELDLLRRFIGPVDFVRKRRLLTAAQCLLVPSLAAETSSLVAREAIACGTPVIGFAHGALPETVDEGRTGFIVGSTREMALAIAKAAQISPGACRQIGTERFSLGRMVGRYIDTYRHLVRRGGRELLERAA
jgi:glycosyltransferase involved in cell wall biosynthesis